MNVVIVEWTTLLPQCVIDWPSQCYLFGWLLQCVISMAITMFYLDGCYNVLFGWL